MKKNLLLSLFIIPFALISFAQQEASYWYFGRNAGLKFSASDGTVTAITNGQINTLEGCTSISDSDGNLLFYSDGRTVWNANHTPMANANYFSGTGLLGDPSSTSSGLIVPKPQDDEKYYLFTVDEPHHNNASTYPNQYNGEYDSGGFVPGQDDGFNNGFNYSLIDMNLVGGLGDVVGSEKNIPLISYDASDSEEIKYKCSEKITAVRAEDCSSFWVITHFVDKYYAYKVTTSGVNTTPVVSEVGPEVPISGYRRNALGYLKASPNGSKLAVAHFGFATITGGDASGGIYLMDFDTNTGIVSNSVELYSPQNFSSPYGVEFSAESKKLYATINDTSSGGGSSSLLQWDLESSDIKNSIELIHQSFTLSAGALQLGIDKKIYRAQVDFGNFSTSGNYLGVINNPEEKGVATNYKVNGVFLDVSGSMQNQSRIGLPPFIQSLFNSEIDIIRNTVSTTELNLCAGDSYTLTADDISTATYEWFKDGSKLNSESSFQLLVSTPGFYEVYIEPGNGECPIEGSAVVGVFDVPSVTKPMNLEICADNELTNIDLGVQDDNILNGQNPDEFEVLYFTSVSDALSGNNNIIGFYDNSDNPQTIYARVQNIKNPNCFAVTDFKLEIFINPTIGSLSNITICDNSNDGNFTDSIDTIDLNTIKSEILGSQDSTKFEISFHPTQLDADNKTAVLPSIYSNTNLNSEEIFVRIENKSKKDCFRTDSFIFTVNRVPIANDLTIIQCDEDDALDGLTSYELQDYIPEITAGEITSTVNFYESISNLQSDIDEITSIFENVSNPQTVYALVTNTITGCESIAELRLETSSTFSSDTFLEACDDDGTEDGFYAFDLSQANGDVLGGLPAGLDIAYYETYVEALSENNPLPNNFTNSVPYFQTIFARVENANNCYGISKIELNVLELPKVESTEEVFYCLNSFPQNITLTSTNEPENNYYFDWSTGETTRQIQINEVGSYTVRTSSIDGCFKDKTITVSPSNIATITEIQVTDASSNNIISVIVSGEGIYQYALDSAFGEYQDSPIFENVAFGLRTVYVRDIKSDCGVVEKDISVIGFPKFFTPNGDAFNQYWKVQGISDEFQAQSEILIFDRYGKTLAIVDPLGEGWDGTHNGKMLPASDYWFVVNLQDGRTFRGHFTLKR